MERTVRFLKAALRLVASAFWGLGVGVVRGGIVAGVSGGILVFVAGAVGLSLLATQEGRAWVSRQVENRVNTPERTIHIGAIPEFNTAGFVLESLVLADGEGTWLDVRAVRVQVRVIDWFFGRRGVRHIDVGQISLSRVPDSGADPVGESPQVQAFSVPRIPRIHVDHFIFRQIDLAPAVTGGEAGHLSLEGSFRLAPDPQDARLTAHLTDLESGQTLLDVAFVPDRRSRDLGLRVEMSDSGQGLLAALSGVSPLDVRISGTGTLDAWTGDLHVQAGEGIAAQTDLRLSIRGQESKLTATGSVRMAPWDVSGTFTLAHNFAKGESAVAFVGDARREGAFPLEGKGRAAVRYRAGVLALEGRLAGTNRLFLEGRAQLPVSLDPPALRTDQPLSAQVTARMDMTFLDSVIGFDEHRVGGFVEAEMAFSGTMERLLSQGTLHFSEGTYENILFGTRFQDVIVQARLQDRRMILQTVTGTDGGTGRFSMQGDMSLGENGEPAWDMTLTADRLRLAETAYADLTASGDLRIQGEGMRGLVSGRIGVDSASFYIAEIPGTDPYQSFEIIETGGENPDSVTESSGGGAPFFILDLDVAVRAVNGIFVRAPNLTTEWGADLRVRGTAQEPALFGTVSLVRGRYDILDVPLELETGVVRFEGTNVEDPDLDVTGFIRGHGTTARIRIFGSASVPRMEISSEEGFPPDEALSRALFGESLTNLSPLQALRVAQLLAFVSGNDSGGLGFDPVDVVRRAIGADMLRVEMDADRRPSVSAGKYIGERLFIAVEQGVTPGTGAVRTEIRITDHLEVETRTSTGNESHIGINWKRDY